MLKIKKNIDFEILKKLGFKFDPYSDFYFHDCGLEFYCGDLEPELQIAWNCERFCFDYIFNILFDMIKHNLVEKK